jgi:hypothetical protein
MNLKSIIMGLAVYLPMAMISHAATMSTTLDWQFNTGANPSSPNDSAMTTNNSGGVASCEIASETFLYYFFNAYPTVPPGGYGPQRGLWDTIDGTYTLTLSAGILSQGQTLTYNLDIYQFLGDTNFLPATISITPSPLGDPAPPALRTLVFTNSSGSWVHDTFTWTNAPDFGPLTLTISPSTNSPSGELLVDEIQWNIIGNIGLAPLPPLMITSVAPSTQGLAITWSGGLAPYQVYASSNIIGAWQAVGPPVSGTNADVPLTGPVNFLRVSGSSP